MLGETPRCFDSIHGKQDALGDELEAGIRIQHQMVELATRPFCIEVLADERGALLIDGIHHLRGLFLLYLQTNQATYFFVARAKYKGPKGVMALAENVRRAASDNDAVALFCFLLDHAMGEFNHGVGIEDFVIRKRQCALVAAPPEDLGETMHECFALFFATATTRVSTQAS